VVAAILSTGGRALKSVRVPRRNPISFLADLVKLSFYTGLLMLRGV
jgi:hypothetical protein